MKKILISMVAVMMMAMSANAQCCNCKGCNNKKKGDRVEMRTNKMVERYGLDKKQAKKLLSLNKEYKDFLSKPGRHPKAGKPGMRHAKPQTQESDAQTSVTPKPHVHKMPVKPERMKEIEQKQQEYDSKLEKIMTSDQFAKYKEDKQRRADYHHGKGKHGGKHAFKGETLSDSCRDKACNDGATDKK